jgi:hypothetical protein
MLGLILAGDVREEVYTQQLHVLDTVLAACERCEAEALAQGAQLTGALPWAKFERTVRSVLPLKRDDLLEEALQAARGQQLNGSAIERRADVEFIKCALHGKECARRGR